MAESSGRLGRGSGSGTGKGAVSADQVRSAEGAGGPRAQRRREQGPHRGPGRGRPGAAAEPAGRVGGGAGRATPLGAPSRPGPTGTGLTARFPAPRQAGRAPSSRRRVAGGRAGCCPGAKWTGAGAAEPRDAHTCSRVFPGIWIRGHYWTALLETRIPLLTRLGISPGA